MPKGITLSKIGLKRVKMRLISTVPFLHFEITIGVIVNFAKGTTQNAV